MREDVDELRTVAVLAADNLLLALVVVPARQKVAEDELRNPDLVLRVLGDGDTITVILHTDCQHAINIFYTDINVLNGICGTDAADTGVACIYNNLIKELVKARIELDLLVSHTTILENPSPLLVRLNGADIGIGQLQDMLTVRKLLVVRS